jgi:hypothetical protein
MVFLNFYTTTSGDFDLGHGSALSRLDDDFSQAMAAEPGSPSAPGATCGLPPADRKTPWLRQGRLARGWISFLSAKESAFL